MRASPLVVCSSAHRRDRHRAGIAVDEFPSLALDLADLNAERKTLEQRKATTFGTATIAHQVAFPPTLTT
jgi:hypothetical protein